jgi:5-formyltetrahydrofolate cyclo-ligase
MGLNGVNDNGGANDAAARKKALRRELLDALKAIPEPERLKSDALIRSVAMEMQAYRQARRLFVYIGGGWEVDTRPLIEEALAAGKQVAVPRCLPEVGRIMEACLIQSLSELRQTPPMNLWEPATGTPVLPPEDIDLALIPCVACDKSGRRLGRGGGYYDRFLRQSLFTSAALCRQALLQEELPVEAHDERVGIIVTETGLYVPEMSYAHNPSGVALADPTWGCLPHTPVVIRE